MSQPSRRNRLLPFLALALLALVVAALLLPWQRLAEEMLRRQLAAQGLGQVRLTVAALGFDGIKLRDVALGDPAAPLLLPEITVGFALGDLWHGRLQTLHLDGVALAATQQDGQWRIAGFDSSANAGPTSGVGFPVTPEQIAALPLAQADLTHGLLRLTSPVWALDLPLELGWRKQPTPRLIYHGDGPVLKIGALKLAAATMGVELGFDPALRHWRGSWQINDLTPQGNALDVPPLKGAGTLTLTAETLNLDGNFVDSSRSWNATFKVSINLKNLAQSLLTLAQGSLPWNGGTISVAGLAIPLAGKADIHVPLLVKGVSIDVLMQQLTGKRATAQGVVSGILPVTFKTDGTISVDQGHVQAEAPGVIAIDPAAIPGDNDQIALVREVLQNLHYTLLALGIDNAKDGKLALTLTVEGRNPNVQNGRQVKLQVHLGGDVLEFARQSLLSFTDPKQLLRQDDHDQK